MHSALFDHKKEKEIQELYGVLYLRLQMSCVDFDRVSEIGLNTAEDGATIKKDPPVRINAIDCAKLFKKNRYYYLQGPSIINLQLTDSTWKSEFPDGTYSLLSLSKINACEFLVTYKESNNFIVANVLKKGHQFRYKVIEEFQDYFELVGEDVSTKKKQLFKLYK